MGNKKVSICILLMSMITAAYAGPMGPVKKTLPAFIPFISGEGMYTWPQVSGGLEVYAAGVGTFSSEASKLGWGGRVAAGALHPFSEKWAASVEAGWGYYGSVDIQPKVTLAANSSLTSTTLGNALRSNITQYGFDILIGAYFMKPKYDLFFKAGALIENMRSDIVLNPTGLVGKNNNLAVRFPGVYRLKTTFANVLPEIKLGGDYHIKKNWLVTAAWMHAFSQKLDSSQLGIVPTGTIQITNFSGYIYSPTLDTLLVGLEYRFA
jgi:hypothetical protein